MLIFRPKGGLSMDFETIGCCGLFCESCDIYQSVQKGTLKKLASKWDMAPEDLTCDGCRSGRHAVQSSKCYIRKCCQEKGLGVCGECDDFPCATLKKFNDHAAPHRSLAVANCEMFREVGLFEGYHIQKEKWSCTCGEVFSWYQSKCSRCNGELENLLDD